ncbi:MAG TPA: methionine adenosyltransferase [Anaerolineales bacterium]
MSPIIIEELNHTPVEKQRVELVERKGTGHPDSICDAIMEQISLALSREYLDAFGRILHHNIDKGLLVAGRTEPRLGGGRVLEPMRLVIGDRATAEYRGKRIDIAAIAEQTTRDWIRQNLRFVDPEHHLIIQNELKEGSPELTDIFAREKIGANDTSAAVGYAPLTETEHLVLDAERFLNSPHFKREYPEAGEDIKVMAYRCDRHLTLTIALAFVDRFVPDIGTYFSRKEEIRSKIKDYLANKQNSIENLSIEINTLDDPDRGESGVYLTVLGTSAEGGDGGQVGRGNKVNGVIALNRPMSTEAAAGKNPISHVGKIYTLLTHHIAAQVYQMVPGIEEVYVWLCSQIGEPIDQPLIASAQLVTSPGVNLSNISSEIKDMIQSQLEEIDDFTMRLARGEMSVW